MTVNDWIALAPAGERWIPITYDGTVIYDRENKTQSFASPSPEGVQRFRKLFRLMSTKAKALGFKKAEAEQ